jgi:tetratricopeptide (TPR) repeat protein
VGHARRAAERARDAYANREALVRYGQALDAAERAGLGAATRAVLLEARAGVHAATGGFEPACADLEEALGLAEAAGDNTAQGRLLSALGGLWGGHLDYERGLELAHRAVVALERGDDRRALAQSRAGLGVMALNLARFAESQRDLEIALLLYRELDDAAGQGRVLEILGMNSSRPCGPSMPARASSRSSLPTRAGSRAPRLPNPAGSRRGADVAGGKGPSPRA